MRRALILAASLAAASPATGCEVALVVAIDVSRSVDAREFDLIRHGTAEAFRHKEILRLVDWLEGGIAVAVTQWSGEEEQAVTLDWRHVTGSVEMMATADAIDEMRRAFRYELTAPGEALAHAAALLDAAPVSCRRQVIDLSGDGVRNAGLDTAQIADSIEARGVTINGLVVRGDTPDPLEFYETEVRRGPLGFIEIAEGYVDFGEAMFRKLLRELTPSLSENRP
jgi:Ca-activated chloride channel family protein